MKISVKENSWIAKIAARKLRANQVAITIGSTIYLYHCSRQDFLNNKSWTYHEVQHVKQFQQYGLVAFTFMYLWESLRKGYYNNKWEQEARAAENKPHILHGIEFI